MGFLDFFKKNKNKEVEIASEDLERPENISALLSVLCSGEEPCTMLIGREVFHSSFVYLGENHILTSLMIPLAGNTLLAMGEGLRFNFLSEGTPYQFYSTYQGRSERNDRDLLQFLIPSRIIHVDRREDQRIKPDSSLGIKVMFDLGVSSMPEAMIENISTTGLAIRGELTETMRVGARVERLDIVLPDNRWISCNGVVRRIRGEVTGIELLGLSKTNKALLREYVGKKNTTGISSEP